MWPQSEFVVKWFFTPPPPNKDLLLYSCCCRWPTPLTMTQISSLVILFLSFLISCLIFKFLLMSFQFTLYVFVIWIWILKTSRTALFIFEYFQNYICQIVSFIETKNRSGHLLVFLRRLHALGLSKKATCLRGRVAEINFGWCLRQWPQPQGQKPSLIDPLTWPLIEVDPPF